MALLKITVSPRLLAQLKEYAETHDDMSIQEAGRYAMQMGLSVAPKEDVIIFAQQRAFDKSRRYFISAMASKTAELADEARELIGEHKKDRKP